MSKRQIHRRGILAILLAAGALSALAIACGGGTQTVTEVQTVVVEKPITRVEKVVETVVVEKQIEGKTVTVVETVVVEKPVTRTERVVQTVVVEKPVTQTERVVETVVVVATPVPATPVPDPRSDTLVIAFDNIGFPSFVPWRSPVPNSQFAGLLGIQESPLEIDESGNLSGLLAESWEFNADFTELTFRIKRGVPFHGGNGEVTADDFVYSWEEAVWTEGTIASGTGLDKQLNSHMSKLDDYTVSLSADEPRPTWLDGFVSANTTRAIHSKAVLDRLGPDKAMSAGIGSGPYELESFRTGDRMVLSRVPNHHHRDPAYGTVIVREIAEITTRLAALEAGEVDVTDVPTPLIRDIEGKGFDVRGLPGAGVGFTFYPAGQFCWGATFNDNPVPPRPAYDPSIPYIGDCNDPSSMERARNVRWGLAASVDREALVETIGAGKAFQQHVNGMGGAQRQAWLSEIDAKWTIPYDLDVAKKYLADGGYPDGFEADLVITTGHPLAVEVGEAVAGMWRAIGVEMNIETLTYQAHRVGLVNRERNNIWLWARSHARDGTLIFNRHPGGAFNPGFELPELITLVNAVRGATTQASLRSAQEAVWDYTVHNMISIETMGLSVTIAINPNKIKEWPMGLSDIGYPRSLDRISRP